MKAATAVLAAVVMAALVTPGCLEPFRVRVDPVVLADAPGWVVTPGGVKGDWFSQQRINMRYAFDRDTDDPPPFPGVLEVYSLRSPGRLDDRELRQQAEALVLDNAEAYRIELEAERLEGRREISSGVATEWFVQEGRTFQRGTLFDQDVEVRFLAEFGTDGRSDTSFIALALAQVGRTNQCPIVVNCQPEETSLQTWIQIVGDPEGHIQGATSSSGFVDSLVTR